MSHAITAAVWKLGNVDASGKLVLLALADHANEKGLCWPSLGALEKRTTLARSSICRKLKELEAAGFIRRDSGSFRNSTSYHLTIPEGEQSQDGTSATIELVPASDVGSPTIGRGVVPQSDGGSPVMGPESTNESVIENQPRNQAAGKPAEEASLFADGDSIKPETVMEVWNAHRVLPSIRALTTKRRQALTARLRDADFRENFREAIGRITESPFCRGENDRRWRADLDWFLRPDTLTKILEGKYDAPAAAKPQSPGPRPAAPEPPSWRSEWKRLRPGQLAPASWAHAVADGFDGWLRERSDTLRAECAALEGRAA